jgi:drug/metabolite transporter (DMT)-like permease
MVRALLLLAVLIWGIQPLVIKIVLDVFSVSFAAFARSLVAAVFFGLVALLSSPGPASVPSPSRLSTRGLVLWLVVGGLGLGLGNVLWNLSLTRTTVGASSVLQMGANIIIALYGILVLQERCTALRTMGLLLSLGGMFIVSWNGEDVSALASSRYFQGNMLALASGIAFSLCAIAQKVSVPGRSSVSVAVPIFALSALTCGTTALFGPVLVSGFNPAMLAALILTGLIGMGLGNVLFTESVRTVTASVGAAALAACPMVSLVCATLMLHEPTSAYLLAGAPLICAGVAAAIVSEPVAIAGGRPA